MGGEIAVKMMMSRRGGVNNKEGLILSMSQRRKDDEGGAALPLEGETCPLNSNYCNQTQLHSHQYDSLWYNMQCC